MIINKFNDQSVNYAQMNLIFNARNLWRNLATWMRAYLVARFTGIDISDDIFMRLYEIPVEFGHIFRLIFGDQITDKYVQQLSSAIVLFKDFIEAEIAGDTDHASEIAKQLYQSADNRAAFLASINPYWSETEWKNLIYTFYKYTYDEITSFLSGNPRSIPIFDQILKQADKMGDYLAQGLFYYILDSTCNLLI